MKTAKKFFMAAVLFVMVGTGASAFAAEVAEPVSNDSIPSYDQPMGYENYWDCVSRKLGRGISNAALGALEIPLKIYDVRFEEGGIAGLLFGTLNGIGYFVARELVGVFEIVTFLIPMPFTPNDAYHGEGWGFGPIMNPEWILTPETDPWNTVYPNTAIHD